MTHRQALQRLEAALRSAESVAAWCRHYDINYTLLYKNRKGTVKPLSKRIAAAIGLKVVRRKVTHYEPLAVQEPTSAP